MLTTTKPPKCRHCKKRMPEEERGRVLHSECVEPWTAKFIAKRQAAEKAARVRKERAEKAEHRQKLAAHKKLSAWFAEAQVAVNAFIRARDAGLPCVSCGTQWAPDFQAGHYRSVGAAKHLALDPRNIHGQCIQCNLHKHSNAVEYRIRLVERFGAAFVEAIECDQAPRHYSADDLAEIKKTYAAKCRELKKEQA